MTRPLLLLLTFCAVAHAKLTVSIQTPKPSGEKSVVKLTLKNTFTNKIESARATVFLLNDENKVVAQATQWVIGGVKNNLPLLPDKTSTYNFVLKADKPFAKTKVTFTRIVLEGGTLTDGVLPYREQQPAFSIHPHLALTSSSNLCTFEIGTPIVAASSLCKSPFLKRLTWRRSFNVSMVRGNDFRG